MQNLLDETVHYLKESLKVPSDVEFVRFGESFYCSWDEFSAVASFNYDNGYGGAEIDLRLKVVGRDWWLERGEYDGSEWWEFKTFPEKPEHHRVPVGASDLQDR